MGFGDSQDKLKGVTYNSSAILYGDEEEGVEEETDKKKGGFDFLQWIFGWILDPITAIIDGIVGIVKFVINAIKFCINLKWCIKWYIFYMIGTILYLPISILFMFFGLQKIEKKIWKAKNQLHDLIVCNTGYNIISYSDEIRDGCFFETIKPRKCPKANMPNTGLSDILAEFMRGMFSFSYIGVVTALSFFFFCLWFVYYFVKPWMVRFYQFIMSYTKQKVEQASAKISDFKKDASAKISDLNAGVSQAAENVSTTLLENKPPSSGILNPSSLLPNLLNKKVEGEDLTKIVL